MIGGVSVVLPLGSIYSRFDTKKLYIVSVATFSVGSALCGGAPTLDAFVVGRAIAGMGGIGMYLGVMALLSVNTTPAERPLYLGLVYSATLQKCYYKADGSKWPDLWHWELCRPVIGGAFATSKATWRWGFYVNLCIIGLLSPVYLLLILSFQPQRQRKIFSRLREVDFAGTVLSIGCLVCLVMAINFGGTLYRWGIA